MVCFPGLPYEYSKGQLSKSSLEIIPTCPTRFTLMASGWTMLLMVSPMLLKNQLPQEIRFSIRSISQMQERIGIIHTCLNQRIRKADSSAISSSSQMKKTNGAILLIVKCLSFSMICSLVQMGKWFLSVGKMANIRSCDDMEINSWSIGMRSMHFV